MWYAASVSSDRKALYKSVIIIIIIKCLLTDHSGSTGQCSLRATVEVINGRRATKRLLKMSVDINAACT